jgi:hypothetical protein
MSYMIRRATGIHGGDSLVRCLYCDTSVANAPILQAFEVLDAQDLVVGYLHAVCVVPWEQEQTM